MKQIPLTQNKFALVDDDDYEFLMQWDWYAHKSKRSNVFYARRNDYEIGNTVHMHRVIMKTSLNMECDHKDNDGLNNQKHNLRNCTNSQNRRNSRKPKHNTSGYKGVCWSSQAKKWRAKILVNKKVIHLGYFENPKEAAMVYDDAATKYYGEYARTNLQKEN